MRGNILFRLCWVLAVGMLFFAYSDHFENPFHFDDDHTIVSNTAIRDLHNIPSYFTDAGTTSSLPANQGYRPWLTALNAMDYAIQEKVTQKILADSSSRLASWEQLVAPKWSALPNDQKKTRINPFYFHLHIFLGFLLLGFVLFFLLKKIFNDALPHSMNRYTALAGTALFWVHTANAETINYIISRSDSNSTTALVVSLACYLLLRKPWNMLAGLFFFTLALFIKEPAIMLAGILLFYDLFFKKDNSIPSLFVRSGTISIGKSFLQTLPFFIIGLLFMFLSKLFTPPTWNAGGAGTWEYLGVQPYVMMHYVQNFFLPTTLSADSDWMAVFSWKDPRIYTGLTFVFIMLYLAWHFSASRITRPISFGILWFFLALLPTSSFIPLAEVTNDHRTFFPYIGLVIACCWFIALLIMKRAAHFSKPGPKILLGLVCFLFFSAHVLGTRERSSVWSSAETLWKDVTLKSPGNGRGIMNYGNTLMARGDYEGAWEQYKKAEALTPNYSYLLINMGVLKGFTGFPEEAENYFNRALTADKNNPECYYYFAQFLMMNGRIGEALEMNQLGLKLSPAHTLLLQQDQQLSILGNLQQESKLDLAIKETSTHPGLDSYLQLSYEFFMAGKFEQSIKAAEEALKFDPRSDRAWNNICSGNNALKRWALAVEAGKKALEFNPQNELARNNLNLALDSLKAK